MGEKKCLNLDIFLTVSVGGVDESGLEIGASSAEVEASAAFVSAGFETGLTFDTTCGD